MVTTGTPSANATMLVSPAPNGNGASVASQTCAERREILARDAVDEADATRRRRRRTLAAKRSITILSQFAARVFGTRMSRAIVTPQDLAEDEVELRVQLERRLQAAVDVRVAARAD